MIDLSRLKPRLGVSGRVPVSGVPQGFDAMLLPEIAQLPRRSAPRLRTRLAQMTTGSDAGMGNAIWLFKALPD